MNRRTLIRSEAQLDIRATALWYDRRERGLGQRFLKELNATLDLITARPFMFPLIDPIIRRALLARFPYSVYFKVESDHVAIVAVLHQRRDPIVLESR